MLEVMDAGMVDWGVDHCRSKRLQFRWEALLEAYANLDAGGVREKGADLVNLLVDVVVAESIERTR
jgi:hypothetical protein